jgi:hypothetical protein
VTATATVTRARKLDPNKLSFRLMFEVRGADAATLNRALMGAGLQGWSAAAIPRQDCSHGQLNDGGWQSFVRVFSPATTIQGGGLDAIQKALAAVQSTKAVPGQTGAMRFIFRRDTLDDQGTTNLVRMHAANEDLLYLLGQHGATGRPLAHKLAYASSLGTVLNQNQVLTSDGWAGALRGKHGLRINDDDPSNWEIRYLDSVFDGPSVANTLQLVCGMVSAAAEGTTSWSGVNGAQAGKRIERLRWNAFMRDAAPPQLRQQLEANLRKAGGVLPPGLTEGGLKGTGQMLSTGYSFLTSNGDRLPNPEAVQDHVEWANPVRIVTPQGLQARLDSAQVNNFVLGETGNVNELPADVKTKLTQLRELQSTGVHFIDAEGHGVLVTDMATRASNQGLFATNGDGRIALDPKFDTKELKAALSPATTSQSTFDMARQGGCELVADKEPITWAPQIDAALKRGTLSGRKAGVETALGSTAAIEKHVLVPVYTAALTAEQQATCHRAEALATRNWSFGRGGVPVQPGTLAFARAVAEPVTDLTVTLTTASTRTFTVLPTKELLHTLLAIESGDDASLSSATRDQMELLSNLQQKGYAFFKQQTHLQSRSGAVMALQTPGPGLCVRVPGGQRQLPVQESTLRHLLNLERSNTGALPSPLADAVAVYSQLQPGTMVQMQEGAQWKPCNLAEMTVCLSENQPLGLLNSAYNQPYAQATPNRTVVTGTSQFVDVARQRIEGSRPTEVQQTTVNDFRALLLKGLAAQVDGTQRSIGDANLLPWLMNDKLGLEVRPQAGSAETAHVGNWAELTRLVDVESGRPSETNAQAVSNARLIASLRHHELKFYTVPADKKAEKSVTPLSLNTSVVDHMSEDGVQVRTPRLIWWGALPCKKVIIKSAADLEKLQRKFHAG